MTLMGRAVYHTIKKASNLLSSNNYKIASPIPVSHFTLSSPPSSPTELQPKPKHRNFAHRLMSETFAGVPKRTKLLAVILFAKWHREDVVAGVEDSPVSKSVAKIWPKFCTSSAVSQPASFQLTLRNASTVQRWWWWWWWVSVLVEFAFFLRALCGHKFKHWCNWCKTTKRD